MKATLVDEFVLAHFLGWWAKALALRNYTLLFAGSILFEAAEASLKHILPNFNECWWDSWVLDAALCNTAGILLGMATVRWLDCRRVLALFVVFHLRCILAPFLCWSTGCLHVPTVLWNTA